MIFNKRVCDVKNYSEINELNRNRLILNTFIKPFRRIFLFYYEGFKSMTIGKSLWLIILIKLFIIFVVLKLFFFPDLLKKNFKTEEEKGNYVIQELTKNVK
jgi:hypothetical protein